MQVVLQFIRIYDIWTHALHFHSSVYSRQSLSYAVRPMDLMNLFVDWSRMRNRVPRHQQIFHLIKARCKVVFLKAVLWFVLRTSHSTASHPPLTVAAAHPRNSSHQTRSNSCCQNTCHPCISNSPSIIFQMAETSQVIWFPSSHCLVVNCNIFSVVF